MTDQNDRFQAVFSRLVQILKPYEPHFIVNTDTPQAYTLVSNANPYQSKEPLHFGYIAIKKNYVSFHLIPVYAKPALLDDVSAALKKRMQGKSCFNFTKIDEALFEELAHLTQRGYESFVEQGYTVS